MMAKNSGDSTLDFNNPNKPGEPVIWGGCVLKMKRIIILNIVFLIFSVFSCIASELDLTELQYYEKANPYDDLNTSIEKGDLRFIALMGIGIVIPGVSEYHEEYSAYNYKVIKGTSDVIQSYEHGRLTTIANYYAGKYNRGLANYINKLKSQKVAKELSGYKKAEKLFQLNDVTLGNINMLPYSLHIDLVSKTNTCLNGAWWFNPVTGDKPSYDWNQFIELFDEINQVVCQHVWIKEWLAIEKNRTAEAHVFGIRPYTETDFPFWVEIPWEKSGLQSEPYYEILLRESTKWIGTIYISKNGSNALITKLKGSKGTHWLDKQKISYHPKSPATIVVNKVGEWKIIKK